MLQVCDRLHTALDGSGEVAATDHSFLPLLEITAQIPRGQQLLSMVQTARGRLAEHSDAHSAQS